MAKITQVQNFGDVHRYVINKEMNIHQNFCNFISDLSFNEDSVEKIDIIFDDLNDEFIYLANTNYDIYFFITKEKVNFVIKTDVSQENLISKLSKYFTFFN